MSLLAVSGLRVELPRTGGVLRDVGLRIDPGECLAVVGESGAGKSVLARTLMGLTSEQPGARVSADRLTFAGEDLLRLSRRGWRRVRGAGMALVLQDALQSLDPLRTIGAEIAEPLAVRGVPRRQRPIRTAEALSAVGLPGVSPSRRAFELSGGQRQRALIAAAIVAEPALIIADEPTTALDATTAAHVLDLLARLRDGGASVLLITHDLDAVSRVADRIAVLASGRIIEEAQTRTLLKHPAAPETAALLAAVPRGPKPLRSPADGPAALVGGELACGTALVKRYRTPDGIVTAVDEVDVRVRAGEVVGVVGESGSGKSTLARLLLGTERPDSGTVSRTARRIRLVPQDPLASFDPRHRVERILRLSRRDDAPEAAELLARVDLDPALASRLPASLSGGQRQRVAIARALAACPDLLVLDEPVSALDVTTQAGILDLLLRLQRDDGVGMVFISHDLAVVRRISDHVLVMRDGRVVERGATEEVYTAPQHPFTRDLIAAHGEAASSDAKDPS